MRMSLDTCLSVIRAHNVNLRDREEPADETNPHRPDMSVWAACDDDDNTKGHVVLTLRSLWGQPQCFVEMTPAEAWRLADALNAVAFGVKHAMTTASSSC